MYRILDTRFSCSAGEIDIIARRARRLAFVEVKHRTTIDAAVEAVTWRNQDRVIEASHTWLCRHPAMNQFQLGYDIVAIAPGQWPRHFPDGFDLL